MDNPYDPTVTFAELAEKGPRYIAEMLIYRAEIDKGELLNAMALCCQEMAQLARRIERDALARDWEAEASCFREAAECYRKIYQPT